MLLRVLSHQVSTHSPLIRDTVKRSLSKEELPLLNETEVLARLLKDEIQVWAVLAEDARCTGICVTMVITNLFGIKQLLIFALAKFDEKKGLVPFGEETFRQGYETLTQFALQQGCASIVAYTEQRSIAEMVRSLGGTVRAYAELPVRSVQFLNKTEEGE